MKRAILVLAAGAITAFAGTQLKDPNHMYSFEYYASDARNQIYSFESSEEYLSVEDVLKNADISYETKPDGTIASLEGIISTNNKQWRIYINNDESTLHDRMWHRNGMILMYE